MTTQHDCTLSAALLEQIASEGLDALPDLMRTIINAAMEAERQQHLGVSRYERSPERRGSANGFKPKTMTTRVGAVTFAVPQVRDGSFYPSALERGLRSERALTLALAEMYVQGVSTRRVAAITEQLCGVELSSSQVSRATAQLDPILDQWRNRPLGELPYLYLDARYEKVRQDGHVRDAAVLIATGVNRAGHRQILGVSVSLSEQEVHWRQFLQGLVARGLVGVQLVISDAHDPEGSPPPGRAPRDLRRSAVAALPVSPSAERRRICAAPGPAGRGGGGHPGDLHGPQSARGRDVAGQNRPEICQSGAAPECLVRNGDPGRIDRVCLPSGAPSAAADHQRRGAAE